MEFRSNKKVVSRLDMTPLIDVVLLLLIFFMISSTFVTASGIKVKLPKSTTQEVTKEQDIVVVVTEEGQIYLDNRGVSIDQLRFILKEKVLDGKDHLLIVKADKDSKHGRVVEVMDLAKEAGIFRLAIATAPIQKK